MKSFSQKTILGLIRSLVPKTRDSAHKSFDDVLFDMFKEETSGLIPMGKFLAALRTTGIKYTDPRLREVMNKLDKAHQEYNFESGSRETLKLDRESFKRMIAPNIKLITKAFRGELVLPDFPDFVKDIEEMYWAAKGNNGGKVADYIPQLAKANKDSWGVSVCTVDGQRFAIGDVKVPFPLQSCSKSLTYAMALEALGPDVVHKYVGTEPSGRNFNEIVLDSNMKPHNPMINSGAIVICSLLATLDQPKMSLAEKFDYIMSFFSRLAAHKVLGFNNAVFLSERDAADRNYALGFYMREYKCFPEKTNFTGSMELYFQCCSMEADCNVAAIMAATLANGGVCPLTNEKVIRKPDTIRNVLSLMYSCGMYDYSGQFAFQVGMPAKSGVSGCMLIVVPNAMGICTWSPPLDRLGNSVRGIQFCHELVGRFNFHRYDNMRHATHKKDPRIRKTEAPPDSPDTPFTAAPTQRTLAILGKKKSQR